MFQIKIFVPNKMFLPKESTCSKWKYLFQTDLFFPKGYIFATIISCAELFHLHILLTSGLHWNGNIFSKWKTNLHLPHRLAQSPLGVTKPENGILNIKNFYILENQSFFDMILLDFSFSQSCAHSYEDNDVFDDSFTNAAEFITFTVNQLW